MEFGFTAEQEKLRKECHEFFINELPEDFKSDERVYNQELQAFWMSFQKKCGKKGYLTPGWSKESGGLGFGSIEVGIVQEESGYWGIIWPASNSINMCGPGLHLFGTEEQKRRFLPGIANGESVWFQLFTEPEAGSDESNVQMRAVPDGNDFIINGQKSFMTGKLKPDYLYALIKTKDTDPKHRGLSIFLVPADAPGVTYRPLLCLGGYATCEIFFDDVRVSKDYLLGELNRGFYHAMATLMFERSGTKGPAAYKRGLEELVQLCKDEKPNGKPLFQKPDIRKTLAQVAVDNEVQRLTAWYTQWRFGERKRLGPQPYDLIQYYRKTTFKQDSEAMMKVLGMFGPLREGSKWSKLAGKIERRWELTRSNHGAGSTEIQKVVIAQRGLGLPRVPAKFNKMITEALKEEE